MSNPTETALMDDVLGRLQRQQHLLEIISRAQSQFIRETDRRKAFDGLLADILALTRSEYGFIGEVLRDADGQPYLKTYAITNIAWNAETRAFYDANAPQGMEFCNLKTLFGAAMTSGKPVIANNPAHDPRRGGLPSDHPALNAFLGVPVHYGGELVAMFGISNRPGGYDEALVDFLQPIVITLGQLVDAARTRQRQQAAEVALKSSQALLQSVVESTTDAIYVKDTQGRYLLFNRAAGSFVNMVPADVLGRDDFALFPPEQARQIMALEKEIREAGVNRVVEESITTTAGATTFLSIKGPIFDAEGKVAGAFGISRDITERKRAEFALRDSEQSLRDLLENLAAGVVVHGPDTSILFANPAASSMLGLTNDQMMGKTAIDPAWCFLREDGSPMPLPDYPVNRVLLSKAPLMHYVVGVQRPDLPEITWILCNAYPARDGTGNIRQVVVTFTDITTQQEAQRQVRASEQRYRDLINTTEGIVWEVDARTMQFTFVSDFAERLLGFSVEEWQESGFWVRYLHPDDRDWAVDFCAASSARLEHYDFEYRFFAKDGSIRWLRDIVAVVAEEGAPRWLRGVMVDVTERKRDMEALRMQSLVLANVAEGVNMVRGSDGVIVYTNARFEEMFGYGGGELIGQHVSVLNAPADNTPEETAAEIIRSLTETGKWMGEVHNRKKDGTRFWCGASVAAFDHPEHGQVWVTVQEDITDRKYTELELARHRDGLENLVAERTHQLALAKEQAEAANLAKSAFLSNMSHELRTPLHLILGMTDLAVERSSDETQTKYLGKVKKSGEHLLAIINDILDVAKIDAGALVIERFSFSFETMLGDALALVGPLAASKGLLLSAEVSPEVPDRLLGDALRIKQILINYLGNAIKFSERGEIRVRVEASGLSEELVTLRIHVSDQGVGIPLDRQTLLFQDFVQADASVTRSFGGTGLGLSICRKLAMLMGGSVGFDSQEGAGSTFWAEIKVARAS